MSLKFCLTFMDIRERSDACAIVSLMLRANEGIGPLSSLS